MEKIIEAFQSLIHTVKDNPTPSLLATLLVIALFVAWNSVNNNQLISSLAPNPAINQQHFEEALRVNTEINNAITNLRTEVYADNAQVRQFHNGKQDLTGLPFTYVLTTYISVDKGTNVSESSLSSQPLSGMNATIKAMYKKDLRNPVCIHFYRKDVNDILFRAYLEDSKINFFVMCPIKNLLDYPVGFVGVGYVGEPASPPEIVEARVRQVSWAIAGYLNNSSEMLKNASKKDKKFFGIL